MLHFQVSWTQRNTTIALYKQWCPSPKEQIHDNTCNLSERAQASCTFQHLCQANVLHPFSVYLYIWASPDNAATEHSLPPVHQVVTTHFWFLHTLVFYLFPSVTSLLPWTYILLQHASAFVDGQLLAFRNLKPAVVCHNFKLKGAAYYSCRGDYKDNGASPSGLGISIYDQIITASVLRMLVCCAHTIWPSSMSPQWHAGLHVTTPAWQHSKNLFVSEINKRVDSCQTRWGITFKLIVDSLQQYVQQYGVSATFNTDVINVTHSPSRSPVIKTFVTLLSFMHTTAKKKKKKRI